MGVTFLFEGGVPTVFLFIYHFIFSSRKRRPTRIPKLPPGKAPRFASRAPGDALGVPVPLGTAAPPGRAALQLARRESPDPRAAAGHAP